MLLHQPSSCHLHSRQSADDCADAHADACATDFARPNDVSDCAVCYHDTAADDSQYQYDHNAAPHCTDNGDVDAKLLGADEFAFAHAAIDINSVLNHVDAINYDDDFVIV